MPTNLIDTSNYGTTPVSIWAGDPSAQRVITLDPSFVQPDADGNQIVLPGYPLLAIADNFSRIYPYAPLTTAITTASTALVVTEARFYKPGDTVTVARPYASLTLALTWADGDTATISFDGMTIVHTVSGFTTLTALATAIAATLNAHPGFARRATAIAENQFVHVFGKDGENYAISITGDGTAGSGTITTSAGNLQPNVTVGTIAANGINVTTKTLTLISAAVIRLPVGAPLAIAVNRDNILGITGYQYLIGSTQSELTPESNDLPAYYKGEVHRARLPVFDRWLQEVLTQIVPLPRNA
jgi:hypothetical protein